MSREFTSTLIVSIVVAMHEVMSGSILIFIDLVKMSATSAMQQL